jgi:hypothetical protein
MDTRVTTFVISILAIAGFFYFWTHSIGLDEVQRELSNVQVEMEQMKQSLQQAEQRQKLVHEVAALFKTKQVIEDQHSQIRAKTDQIIKERGTLSADMQSLIMRARQETVGLEMAELTLTTGVTLKKVKIQDINPEISVVQHQEGISKIATETLPNFIQDRLRYGYQVADTFGNSHMSGNTVYEGSTANSSVSTSTSDNLLSKYTGTAKKTKFTAVKKAKVNPYVDGDSSLWNSVDRKDLGRAHVPGQGWLEIGPNGPIPKRTTNNQTCND